MIHALVEGYVDGCLLTALFRQIGQGHRKLVVHDARGSSNFWKSAERYNAAARHKVMVGSADLEQAVCAPAQLSTLKGGVSPNFELRLAERMLESWILADRAAFAAFLGVAPARRTPDSARARPFSPSLDRARERWSKV